MSVLTHPTRRRFALLGASLPLLSLPGCGGGSSGSAAPQAAQATSLAAVKANAVAVSLVEAAKPPPPVAARLLAIIGTAMYDAWAAYDQVAVGTTWQGVSQRRPAAERTQAHKQAAVVSAAYEALADLLFTHKGVLDAAWQAQALPIPPGVPTLGSAEDTGLRAARAVLALRYTDGSNQLGDLNPGAYSDYTGYVPANTPDELRNPSRWQPLRYTNASGAVLTQSFLLPHWGRVRPFALPSGAALRPAPPAGFGSSSFNDQMAEVLTLADGLDDQQKAIVEYWAAGPATETPPGLWNEFGQWVCERDRRGLDADVKLFFALSNACMDAGIAAWDAKVAYDTVRPISAVRAAHANRLLFVPGTQRAQTVMGQLWMPYQPASFPTPPFSEFVSGHSTFSAASAEVLRLFTGNDTFGASATYPASKSAMAAAQRPGRDVKLEWQTFSDAAAQAGRSRLFGGIHFAEGNLAGLDLGQKVGRAAFQRAEQFWLGV